VIVLPIYKKWDRKDPNICRGITFKFVLQNLHKNTTWKIKKIFSNFLALEKDDLALIQLYFKSVTREKKTELKRHSSLFLDYENAFDEIRSLQLFSILQERNIPNPLQQL
jgi:hypothetical protein